jgi:nicotinamidase-related amidase
LIDVINNFESPDGDRILENALPIAAKLAGLKARARAVGIPTIYVNDISASGVRMPGSWWITACSLLRLGGLSRNFGRTIKTNLC